MCVYTNTLLYTCACMCGMYICLPVNAHLLTDFKVYIIILLTVGMMLYNRSSLFLHTQNVPDHILFYTLTFFTDTS